MKRLLVTVALMIGAVPSFAAIQYEFMQKATTGDVIRPSTDLTGRATVDGDRSRVEFLSGNVYPPGTYVVSTDGARRLFFVDPSKKWYTEVNAAGIASALGASNIRISNLKSSSVLLEDEPVIAGAPTVHYRVTLSYDITVTMKSVPLTQHIETEIDSWVTSKYASSAGRTFLDGGIKTGNAEIDQLLDAETSRIAGLPLRQLVTTRTRFDKVVKSKLNTPTSRTLTREVWVTAIRETNADPALFTIPAAFRRADQPEIPESSTQVLTFEPAS